MDYNKSTPKEFPIFKIKEFTGLDNKSDPRDLITEGENSATTFLSTAENIDFTKNNKLRLRPGWELKSSGDYHSAWQSNDLSKSFIVKDGQLGLISNELIHTPLLDVSGRQICYADTTSAIFMSDGQSMWRYLNGSINEISSFGTYDTPFTHVDPTSDNELYDSPPAGTVLSYIFGRLWVANEFGVFYSRSYKPEQFIMSEDFIDLQNVTMMIPVTNGYYIGTEDLVYFFSGGNPKKPTVVDIVSNSGPIKGTGIVLSAKLFSFDDKSGLVAIWESDQGKMLGSKNGVVTPLTYDRVAASMAEKGASFLRELNGETHHISSLANPNSDASNFRTSDTAVGEVIRNGITI